MADVGLPHAAVREQVAGAIDLVVHQARISDGRARRSWPSARSSVWRAARRPGRSTPCAAGAPRWRAPLGDGPAARLLAGGACRRRSVLTARSARPLAARAGVAAAWEALGAVEEAGAGRALARVVVPVRAAGCGGARADGAGAAAPGARRRGRAARARAGSLAGPLAGLVLAAAARGRVGAVLRARAGGAGGARGGRRARRGAGAGGRARPAGTRSAGRSRRSRAPAAPGRRRTRSCARCAAALALGAPTDDVLERLRRRAPAPGVGHDRRGDRCSSATRAATSPACCASLARRPRGGAARRRRRARRHGAGALHRGVVAGAARRRRRCSPSWRARAASGAWPADPAARGWLVGAAVVLQARAPRCRPPPRARRRRRDARRCSPRSRGLRACAAAAAALAHAWRARRPAARAPRGRRGARGGGRRGRRLGARLARLGRRLARPAGPPQDLAARLDAAGLPARVAAADVMAVKAAGARWRLAARRGRRPRCRARLGWPALVAARPRRGVPGARPPGCARRARRARRRAMAAEVADVLDLLRVAVAGRACPLGRGARRRSAGAHRGLLAGRAARPPRRRSSWARRAPTRSARLARRCPLPAGSRRSWRRSRAPTATASPLGPALAALAADARAEPPARLRDRAARAAPEDPARRRAAARARR